MLHTFTRTQKTCSTLPSSQKYSAVPCTSGPDGPFVPLRTHYASKEPLCIGSGPRLSMARLTYTMWPAMGYDICTQG